MLTLVEGADADVITYTIMASPPATILLTRTDGIAVNTERLSVTNQALRIEDVSRNDAGMYNLTFSHPAANEVTFFVFTLEVECKFIMCHACSNV